MTGKKNKNRNLLAKDLRSPLFRPKVVPNKKGKGAYKREGKHKKLDE